MFNPEQQKGEMEKISVTIPEAVRLTGIGRSSLYKLIGEGRIQPRKLGRRTLLLTADLQALLKTLPTEV